MKRIHVAEILYFLSWSNCFRDTTWQDVSTFLSVYSIFRDGAYIWVLLEFWCELGSQYSPGKESLRLQSLIITRKSSDVLSHRFFIRIWVLSYFKTLLFIYLSQSVSTSLFGHTSLLFTLHFWLNYKTDICITILISVKSWIYFKQALSIYLNK